MKKYLQLDINVLFIKKEDVITMSINQENFYDDTAEDFFSEYE